MSWINLSSGGDGYERTGAFRYGAGVVLVVLSFLPLSAAGASAQSAPAVGGGDAPGRILGRVVEAGSAQPIAHAQVFIEDGPGTLSDLNGRFILAAVSSGLVDLNVQALGYANKTVTGVRVHPGEVASVDITVEQRAIRVDGIRVSAARERGSTAYLLDERRSSDALVEALGSTEISRRPDSDAADVAQRMAGVTVSDGKYVFVRGLGERYSQTTLNGSSLPSPEPEREVVPLDLFPSGFLESLRTQKSYTPDLAADFSGGSVQIRTRDFPSRFGGRLSVSTSASTGSQFQDGFLHYAGGGTDWLGLDDGARAQPARLDELLGDVRSGRRLPAGDAERIEIAQALQRVGKSFAPMTGSTPMNRSLDLAVGGRTGLGDESELGYFFAGTYSDRYTVRDGEVERKWRVSAFRDETADIAEPNVDYTFTRGTRAINWGTIANLAYKPNRHHQIALKTTVNLNTDSEARVYVGENREDIGGTVRSDRARFVERLMAWAQLSGEHLAPLDSRLEWRLTGARATRDEPMLRESIYLLNDQTHEFLLLDEAESARYFYSDLVDDDLSAELDWRIPFPLLDREAAIQLGGAYRMRERGFGARRLNWEFLGSSIRDLDRALASGEIVAGSPATGQFAIDETVEPGDVYDVHDDRSAVYAMLEIPVTDRLRVTGGARVETYALTLTSRDSTLKAVDQTDVAPALNVVYAVSSDLKLRGALSRTLDRPEFRELAPFQFTEATSLRQLVGNPDLVPAEITSADLRLDWFPGPREILSIGGFYKELVAPIEQVFIAAASSAYSFQNAEDATVRGLELDARLGLHRLADALRDFSVQANYSWIDSKVNVKREGIFQPTKLSRPLEGQAPYVVNAGIAYDTPSGVQAGLYLNRFGERLTAAGGSGLPDIYERPRTDVDLSLGFPVAGGLRAKLKGTNLLDTDYRFVQTANGFTRVQREYQVGRTFSAGLSWEF